MSPSIFLEPFAPPELPGFVATMAPLTPDRVSPSRSGLFASCVRTSGHSASNHLMAPPIALTRYPSASSASGSLRSGFHLKRAGSPDHPAESSSLALRTGHSPPDAPHPASRRRSFGRLQAGERLPEEDLHLPVRAHLQTHPPAGGSRQLVVECCEGAQTGSGLLNLRVLTPSARAMPPQDHQLPAAPWRLSGNRSGCRPWDPAL